MNVIRFLLALFAARSRLPESGPILVARVKPAKDGDGVTVTFRSSPAKPRVRKAKPATTAPEVV